LSLGFFREDLTIPCSELFGCVLQVFFEVFVGQILIHIAAIRSQIDDTVGNRAQKLTVVGGEKEDRLRLRHGFVERLIFLYSLEIILVAQKRLLGKLRHILHIFWQ
jgi:hypothetical protein